MDPPALKRHARIPQWLLRGRLLLGWGIYLGFALVEDNNPAKPQKTQRLLQQLVCFDWYREKVALYRKPHSLLICNQWETDDNPVPLLGL